MAIPSGSGTEVLKNVYEKYTSGTVNLLTAGSNQIITLLSIVFCETSSQLEELYLQIDASRNTISGSGGQDISLLHKIALPGNGSFIFNDKVVIYDGDVLKFYAGSAGTIDITISYIVQDWS